MEVNTCSEQENNPTFFVRIDAVVGVELLVKVFFVDCLHVDGILVNIVHAILFFLVTHGLQSEN